MMEQPPIVSSSVTEDEHSSWNGAVDPYAPTRDSSDASNHNSTGGNDSSAAAAAIDEPGLHGLRMKTIVSGANTLRTAVSMSRGNKEIAEEADFHPQEDIYSLLFITPFSFCNGAFLYCIFFLAFQGVVIMLIAADLLANGTPDNWLDVPHGVGVVVSISQVFALFIATITQQDVITSLYLASVGYHPTHVPTSASRGKWIFSNVLRFLLGMSIMALCFLFIVQSTTVIDLFKDFAAVTFVAEIDDAAFLLAKYVVAGKSRFTQKIACIICIL